MSRRCECCKLRFYVHHYKWHICTGLTQPTTTLAEPIGDFSVASGTSEYTHNEEARDALVQMRENLSTALANVQSRIPQIFSEPPTRSLSEESTETQITTSRVIPAPSNPYVNVTEEPNEPSYLKDRNCKSSVPSQTSCVQQVKPKETRPSGSKKKPGERTSKAPESATRERAVSISASANSGEMSFAEATRLMFPSAQSTSSSHLRETSTQETTRASVPTTSTRSTGHRSLRTPQETRPSGSKQKPEEGTSKAPEIATRERAVSMSVSENSGGMTFAEATRLMFPSAQSKSSSHLRETSTQEPTTASVPTTSTCLAGRASFRTPRVSSEQAATSGSGLGAEMFVGGPVGSASRGANTDPMLSAQLDDKSLKHYCGLCNKYFDNWVDLDAHIEILKEEGVKNAMAHYYSPTYFAKGYFACMFCNHRFDRQIDLNSHVKAKHQAPTPYKCIYCNKAFQNKESLSNHGACTSSIHLRNTPQTARASVQTASTRSAGHRSLRTTQKTRPSGSKQKPRERIRKPSESATRKRAVSMSAYENSGEVSFAEATRLMFPSAQSTSSSHLRETSTQETTRASVPTASTRSAGHRSLRTPQKTRPSGSKQKPGERTRKLSESATREQAVSMSASENSGEISFVELTRQMFPSAQSTSSSQNLPETSTQETARTSVQKTSTRLELVGSTSRGASAVPMPNALFNNAKSTNAKSTNAKCTKYYCKLCNKYFDKLIDLDAHIDNLLAKGVENAMAHNHSPSYFKQCYFRCMFCERTFDRQIDLDFHRRAKHQVRTPYKCIYCSMECQSRGALSNHEAQKHKGITIHKCKKCHKRFFNENDLETHTCEIPEN